MSTFKYKPRDIGLISHAGGGQQNRLMYADEQGFLVWQVVNAHEDAPYCPCVQDAYGTAEYPLSEMDESGVLQDGYADMAGAVKAIHTYKGMVLEQVEAATRDMHTVVSRMLRLYEANDWLNAVQPEEAQGAYAMSLDEWAVQCQASAEAWQAMRERL